MDLNNIKRNQLDYILTDILPNELSELFSFKYFYEYLLSKRKDVKEMVDKVINAKNKSASEQVLFLGSINWATMPLKYTIMKGLHSSREISLLQPMAAIQIYLFITAFQKELLNIMEQNSVYSLRYHHRNNELYYKNKNKSVIKYFEEESKKTGKDIIEQTGMFFDIKPYKSIAAFTSSEEWFVLNSKYKYFIRTDYKACFDSIYTHTYTWLIGKNVNDTKEFKNVNMYAAIDRILQNINARTSNGIVVGPEFSRMIAEVLLQKIDVSVNSILLNLGIVHGENYNVYRYIDDIFIFADSEELAELILEKYSEVSRKYLLRLNENKLVKNTVPFVLENWLNDTNLFTSRVSSILFNSKDEQRDIMERLEKEQRETKEEKKIKAYIFKDNTFYLTKRSLMNQFNELICNNVEKNKTIVAYLMGMFLKKVSRNKENNDIFRENVSSGTIFNFLDFLFYIYSFYPDYNNTQRFLSIISYIRDEYNIFYESDKLQILLNKYSFVFEKANMNDIINLVLFCAQAKIEIPYTQECLLVETLRKKDDPILWASYLTYSKYSKKYFNEILSEIEDRLKENIESIRSKENVYTYREFWWIIVFNKSPHLSSIAQSLIDNIINDLQVKTSDNKRAGDICGNLFVDFLKINQKQFFEWNIHEKDFLRQITFKTYERSIFKNYKETLNFMDWNSI